MAKKKKTAAKDSPTLEESLEQLQSIVTDLEEGTLGLEESLQRYESGTALLRQCYQVLNEAEQKIEQLTGFDEEGNPVTEPFDASATLQEGGKTAGRRKQSGSGEAPSGNQLFD